MICFHHVVTKHHLFTRFSRPTRLYKRLVFFTLCLLGLNQPSFASEQKRFSFALIGDLPYGVKTNAEDPQTKALIQALNSDNSIAWVLHAGDIKTGGSRCSDEMFEDRANRFARINKPFLITPGDNEWTDCHRPTAGGYDPVERLKALRKIFFDSEQAKSSRAQLGIKQQSTLQPKHTAFVENYYWETNGVAFATVHVTGSMNGRAAFSKLSTVRRQEQHDNEVDAREAAALDWLRFVFEQAESNQSAAVFITIHANPGLDVRWEKTLRPAYKFFNRALEKEIERFGRPVVLAHGDSHYVRIDKPRLESRHPPSNFFRLETFGENNQAWIKVTVDAASPQVFSFSFFDRLATSEIYGK